MEHATTSDLDLALGFCAICDREVLTYVDYEDGEQAPRRCVHCEQTVQHRLRAAVVDDLPGRGYGLLESQGCGNPSCGGGQCSRRQNDQ